MSYFTPHKLIDSENYCNSLQPLDKDLKRTEPSPKVVSALLSFSKALKVQPSIYLGQVENLLN